MDYNVLRTPKLYNLDSVGPEHCDCDGMPIILRTEHVPSNLIPFTEAVRSKDYGSGVHFYIDDYRFERVWREPERYIRALERFDCVLTPDFSTYTDMPRPVQLWNVYRNRALGNLMMRHGIEVIPSLSWGGAESFDFCFGGLPKHSTVAVSTVGCSKRREAMDGFKLGMDEAIRRLEPDTVLVYGKSKKCYDFRGINAVFFDSNTMGGMNGR